MHEADLRRHLAAQGLARVAGLHHTHYAGGHEHADAALQALLQPADQPPPDAVLLDVARPEDLAVVGRLVWERALRQPLLAVGASGVVQALAAHWQSPSAHGLPPSTPAPLRRPSSGLPAARGPVFAVTGSLSPVTARQVHAARSYTVVALDVPRLVHQPAYERQQADAALALLRAGRHVLASTRSADAGAPPAGAASSADVAHATARFTARVVHQAAREGLLRRIGIAGGDTSSLAVLALQAWGLSFAQSIAPGVALCRLHSHEAALDGTEVMLKGGQMGPEDLFEQLVHGNPR